MMIESCLALKSVGMLFSESRIAKYVRIVSITIVIYGLGCMALAIPFWTQPGILTGTGGLLALCTLIITTFTQFSILRKVAEVKLELLALNDKTHDPRSQLKRPSNIAELRTLLQSYFELIKSSPAVGTLAWIDRMLVTIRLGVDLTIFVGTVDILALVIQTAVAGQKLPVDSIIVPLIAIFLQYARNRTIELAETRYEMRSLRTDRPKSQTADQSVLSSRVIDPPKSNNSETKIMESYRQESRLYYA